ncbi:MAG: glycosyltransferase family 39 protein [Elusimicrobia bacterium]|nr:glycosyltransferase family 39 protein [Elusimicrobiota bacterium]
MANAHPDTRWPWLGVGLAVVLGVSLRWAEVRPTRADAGADYKALAAGLRSIHTLGFDLDSGPSARRGVVFPAFIAVVDPASPEEPPRLPRAQALLSGLGIIMAAALAARLCSPWAGTLAAFLVASHPGLIEPSVSYNIEFLFGLMLIAASLAVVRWLREPSPASAAAAGLCVAAGLMCRSVLFAFPLFLCVLLRLIKPGRSIPGRQLGIFLAVSYLALAPWVLRNRLRLKAFIPFEQHLTADTLLAASGGEVEFDTARPAVAELRASSGCGLITDSGCLLEAARRAILADPVRYIVSSSKRLWRGLTYHPLAAVGAGLGLALMLARGDLPALSLAALCLYYFLIYAPFAVVPRFFEPLLPILLVLDGCAVVLLVRRVKTAWRGRPTEDPSARHAAGRSASLILRPLPLLICLPLYLLGAAYLSAETLVHAFPCRMPGTAAAFHCGLELERRGMRAEAVEKYSLCLRDISPRHGSLLASYASLQRGILDWRSGDKTRAQAAVTTVAAASPEQVRRKALALQGAGDTGAALFLLEALVREHPSQPDYLLDLAVSLALAGRFDEALKQVRGAALLAPANPKVLFLEGVLWERAGKTALALKSFAKAMDSAPTGNPADLEYILMAGSAHERISATLKTQAGRTRTP